MYEGIKILNGGQEVDLSTLQKGVDGELILEGITSLKINLDNGASYSENVEIMENNTDVKISLLDSQGNEIFIILRGLGEMLLTNDPETPLFEVFEAGELLASMSTIDDLEAAAAGGELSSAQDGDGAGDGLLGGTDSADLADGPRTGGAGPLPPVLPQEGNSVPIALSASLEDIEIKGAEGEGEPNIITGQLTVLDDPEDEGLHTFAQVGVLSITSFDEDGNETDVIDSNVETTNEDQIGILVNPDGSFEITGDFNDLASGEYAVLSFDFFATDPAGAVSNIATVTITVLGTNDIPVVEDINVNGIYDDIPDQDEDFQEKPRFIGEDEFMETYDYNSEDDYYSARFQGEDYVPDEDSILRNEEPNNYYTGLLSVADDDDNDTHIFAVVEDSLVIDGPVDDENNPIIVPEDITVGTVLNSDGSWNYTIDGDFSALRAGEEVTVSFQYYADDQRGFGDSGDDTNEASISAPATITLTITGTNDQPVVQEAQYGQTQEDIIYETKDSDGEDNYLDGNYGQDGRGINVGEDDDNIIRDEDVYTVFNGTLPSIADEDVNDTHTYHPISFSSSGEAIVNVDNNLIEDYGVIVNSDGTFTLTGDFNALAVDETATVSFEYYVMDDSPFQYPGEPNRSESKLVEVTVTGTNDQPVVRDVNANVSVGESELSYSNGEDFDIIDNTTITSHIYVSDGPATIDDLNVTLNLDHTWVGDLIIKLTSPTGTEIVLYYDDSSFFGNSGDNFENTTFDDEASVSISAADVPFTGSFKPIESLSNLDGEDLNGLWTLSIEDKAGGDTGTLFDWSLDFTIDGGEQNHILYESHDNEYYQNGEDDTQDDVYSSFAGVLAVEDQDVSDTHTFHLVQGSVSIDNMPTQTIVLGHMGEDEASLDDWGYADDNHTRVMELDNGMTVTTHSDSKRLKQYDSNNDQVGTGIGDKDSSGIDSGESISVTFEGGQVNSATFGFAGLGNHFNTNSSQQAKATWIAYNNGVEVARGEVQSDATTATVNSSVPFDEVVFSTNSEVSSDWVLTYVEAEVMPLEVVVNENGEYDVEGNFNYLAAGETATVTFDYYAEDNQGITDLNDPLHEVSKSEPATVTMTITGTNDQPIIEDVTTVVSEESLIDVGLGEDRDFRGEIEDFRYEGSVASAVSDDDLTDEHTFAIDEGTLTLSITTANQAFLDFFSIEDLEYLEAMISDIADGVIDFTIENEDENEDVADSVTIATAETFTIPQQMIEMLQNYGLLRIDMEEDGSYVVESPLFNLLGAHDSLTIGFDYRATDDSGMDGTDGMNESAVSEAKTVTLTINGTNDQPVAYEEDYRTRESRLSDTQRGEVNSTFNGELPGADSGNILEDILTRSGFFGEDGQMDEDLLDLATLTFHLETDTSTYPDAVITTEVMEETQADQNDSTVVVDGSQTVVIVNEDGTFSVSNPTFDNLAVGERVTVSFQYYINDESASVTSSENPHESFRSEPVTVTVTILGSNDRPTVENVVLGVDEVIYESRDRKWYSNGEDDTQDDVYTKVSGTLVAMDDDVNDEHVFNVKDYTASQYYGQGNGGPDQNGDAGDIRFDNIDFYKEGKNDYPRTVKVKIASEDVDVHDLDVESLVFKNNNGNDSEIDFTLKANFNALGVGETATITYQYFASDQRGFGWNGNPSNEASKSEPKLVEITITGTNDQPIVAANKVYTALEADGDLIPTVDDETTIIRKTFEVMDDDVNDTHEFYIVSIGNINEVQNGYELFGPITYIDTNGDISSVHVQVRLPLGLEADDISIDSIQVIGNEFEIVGKFDALSGPLGDDIADILDIKFKYYADDLNGLDGKDGINESSISETRWITVQVEGTNDVPTITVGDSPSAMTEDNQVIDDKLSTSGRLDIDDFDSGESYFNDSSEVFKSGTDGINLGGTFDIGSDGNWTYEVDNTQVAIQSLGDNEYIDQTYTVTSLDGTASHDVTVRIWGENDAPVANDDSYLYGEDDLLTTKEDTPLIIASAVILANDTDAEGDPLTVTDVEMVNPLNGSVSIDSSGNITFTPAPDFFGEVQFKYTVSDGDLEDEGIVTVNVTPVNDDPIARNDYDSVTEKGVGVPAAADLTGNVLGNDTDIDSTDLDVYKLKSIFTGDTDLTFNGNGYLKLDGQYGVLKIDEDGNYIYNLKDNWAATDALTGSDVVTDEFRYRIDDGDGGTATAKLIITVNGTNDAPIITVGEDGLVFDVDENSAFGTSVGDIDSTDVDGSTPIYSFVDENGDDIIHDMFNINPITGEITVKGALDYETEDEYMVKVKVIDQNGGEDIEDVTIKINDLVENVDPEIDPNQAFDIVENSADGAYVGTVSASDDDGDTLKYSLVNNYDGLFAINEDTGVITFTGEKNDVAYNLDYEAIGDPSASEFTLEVKVDDQNGGVVTGDVTVDVLDLNEEVKEVNKTIQEGSNDYSDYHHGKDRGIIVQDSHFSPGEELKVTLTFTENGNYGTYPIAAFVVAEGNDKLPTDPPLGSVSVTTDNTVNTVEFTFTVPAGFDPTTQDIQVWIDGPNASYKFPGYTITKETTDHVLVLENVDTNVNDAIAGDDIDMVRLLSDAQDFDPDGVPTNVLDEIDMTSGNHILSNITVDAVLSMTDTDNTLRIEGDNGDKIELDMGLWEVDTSNGDSYNAANDPTDSDGNADGYVTYTNVSGTDTVQLLIDENIDVKLV